MLFSKKIIAIMFFITSFQVFANQALVEVVKNYKNAYASKNIEQIMKLSTTKHAQFLKESEIQVILKSQKLDKFDRKKYKIKQTSSKVIKDAFQVKLIADDGQEEIFQIKKIKGKYLIDHLVQEEPHTHH